MKKILIILSIFLLILPGCINAKENKLYFTNDKQLLFYDTDLYDESFMKHENMLAAHTYEDELLIENKTKTDYKLYLKLEEYNQEKLEKELLESIKMKIYLDGELIYDGYATGLDYSGDGINLQNALYIGEYKPNKESKLVIKNELIKEYSNQEREVFSKIKWQFYASHDEEVIPINPNTGGDMTYKYHFITIVSLSILLVFILILLKKKRIVQ